MTFELTVEIDEKLIQDISQSGDNLNIARKGEWLPQVEGHHSLTDAFSERQLYDVLCWGRISAARPTDAAEHIHVEIRVRSTALR